MKKQINKEIRDFFRKKIREAGHPYLRKILIILKEYSLRKASRIRAVLVNQGYFLAGGKNKKAILKTSIFIELIHNYLLIHDDILDCDKNRRGKPTLNFSYGEPMAIEMGDIMAALGYEVLLSSGFPEKQKNLALDKLNQLVYSTAYGQMLELSLRERIKKRKQVKEKDIFEIYKSKTAPYSCVGPLQIGAILAGAKDPFLEKIEKFALPLGIAFQIRDDISDIKRDIKENQPTLYRKTGSVEYCQKTVENLVLRAKKVLISEKKFPKKEKQFLLTLTDSILTR
jgi:geranylgeranyl pyrophosphate synthase